MTIKPIVRSKSRPHISWIGETYKSLSMYKYMNVEYAFDFLKNGVLNFVEPTVWKDPYEKRFYTADYSALDYRGSKLFCACFTRKQHNEAAWKMYSKGGDNGIASRSMRFRLSKKDLLDYLETFAAENNCNIYIGDVAYEDTYVINTLHQKELDGKKNHKYGLFFDDFTLDKYLNLLLLKRKDFEYENEIRIFIMPENMDDIRKKEHWGEGLVCPVFMEEHTSKLLLSSIIDPNCTKLETDMIKAMFNEFLPADKKCEKSSLYTSFDTIKVQI